MKLIAWILARVLAVRAVLSARRSARPLTSEGIDRSHRARPIPVPLASRGQQVGSMAPGSADSPLELDPADWKATAKRTLAEMKEDRITLAAAGMAYYFFLAIFPAVIAAIGIMGLVNVDEAGFIDAIRRNLPAGAGRVLTDAVQNAERPSEGAKILAVVAGIAAALWSASSGMVALQSGLNIAYDVEEDRKFVGKRLVAFALLLATALLGGVPSPFFTFGEGLVFSVIGWLLTLVAVTVLFSLFYYVGPKRESPSWRWVSAGGIVGAVLWVVAFLGFGYYATNFSSYGKTYGPLAGVIVLIFLLYLSSLAVLIGGELNSEIERQAARRPRSKL